MAIFGYIKSLEDQAKDKAFKQAFDFLHTTDLDAVFARVSPGNNITIEIDGKNLFAIFQEYDSKLHENAKTEAHKIYTDIQYLHEGSEIIGIAGLPDIASPADYNAEKDIYFPSATHLSHLILTKGTAALLFPEDLHAPGMAVDNNPSRVKKIVFKVKL